ncbi:MAG: MarR family transcriptional regulator [Pseudomonadota bacterium]
MVSNTLCAQTVERLFFAYRDFTDEPDARLEERGLGRAHHRVIHFVSRHPGLAVHDLLDILKITKQSLARVLKQLIDDGFITQAPCPTDRRKRLLYATPSGRALAESLAELQTTRIANAYQSAIDAAGPDASRAILAFLSGMVRPEDRAAVDRLIATNTAPAVSTSSQPLT